jgi:glutamine synthetase
MIRSFLPQQHHQQPHLQDSRHHEKDNTQKKEYPEFVAYHFLNSKGELMAMEEDGRETERYLQEGFTVDGSSIGMTSVERSDLKVVPEKDTFLTLRIGDGFLHHRFLAHLVQSDGQGHPCDPRNVLRRSVQKANRMGYEPYMFSEVEFFLVDEVTGKPVDTAGYCSLPPTDASYEFRHQLGTICKDTGKHSVGRLFITHSPWSVLA